MSAMPKRAKELADLTVAKLQAPGRHAVGGVEGLHLRISEVGPRLWVLRITVGDQRRDVGLGNADDVSLSQARDEARDARRAVRLGDDPAPRKFKLAPVKKIHTFEPTASVCASGSPRSLR